MYANTFFGFFDKYAKQILLVAAAVLLWLKFKNTASLTEETAQAEAVASHEEKLLTPAPAPAKATVTQTKKANASQKEHRSAVLAEKLYQMIVPIHYNGPGRSYDEFIKLAYDVSLMRIPFSMLEKDYSSVAATLIGGSKRNLKADLRQELPNDKYLSFIKISSLPYEQAAKSYNEYRKKK